MREEAQEQPNEFTKALLDEDEQEDACSIVQNEANSPEDEPKAGSEEELATDRVPMDTDEMAKEVNETSHSEALRREAA